ncbi:hypothetical protein ACHQM5_028021 [Ranunculus cassubicifolius]
MDCCNSIRSASIFEGFPVELKSPRIICVASLGLSKSFRMFSLRSKNLITVFAQAKTESTSYKFNGGVAPFKPRSQVGKLLCLVLQKKNHFFQFAVTEQLDELAAGRRHYSDSMQSLLSRRIAEVREKECKIAIEEVIYMSIAHRFSEVEIPMVSQLPKYVSDNRLELWASRRKKLFSIHCLEVQEMIIKHLEIILRLRGSATKISRLDLGRIYGASIMFGYFLKSACLRHKLESSLSVAKFDLKSFVMGFDADSLQRSAKLKSEEAINVIETQISALFRDDRSGNFGSDNQMVITFPFLERLVLEAIAFGSFLWDVEMLVDSIYMLKKTDG